ncbi:MAG: hypothetical protein ACYCOR_19685 [Acidobacteriaceae bacterium]
MDTQAFVAAIDAEISRLRQVKTLLTGNSSAGKQNLKRPVGTGTGALGRPTKRRTMSVEARAKIAAAQKARWAKVKKSAK